MRVVGCLEGEETEDKEQQLHKAEDRHSKKSLDGGGGGEIERRNNRKRE